jgi:starch-binding outer membrane protein, SusD/RagB family
MTRRHLRRVMAVAVVTVTLGACEFIDPVTSNPNAVPEATVDQLFVGVQVNTYFIGVGGLSRLSSIWTQQMAGTDRQFISFDNYDITEQDFDDEMDALYTGGGLVDVRQAIELAEAAGRTPYAGILKIHEAFMVGTIASYYGDIPYSEAVNPAITAPALDDQAAVYAAIQALLDEAITDLGGSGAGPGTVDLAFGGNTDRWEAVANTLKARYHMHWAEVDGTRYGSARTAAQSGIDEAAGNWRAQFSTAATENNLWHQFERDRSGYVSAGDHLVPLMIANSDPRIDIYFDDAPTPTPRLSTLSPTGYGNPAFDFPMVTCSENYFIVAEVESEIGTDVAAQTAARAAAACQEAQHGLAADDLGSVTGFVSVGAALLTEILEQKYIAQFLNPEALNDYKRTCQPALAGAAGMPGRLYYSINERQANPNIPSPGEGSNGTRNDNDPNSCP